MTCVVTGDSGGPPTVSVSSTTPSTSSSSILHVIELEVIHLLRQSVTGGAVMLDVDLTTYATILAENFYECLEMRSADGSVTLSDDTLAELADLVRRNVERRSRRSSM